MSQTRKKHGFWCRATALFRQQGGSTVQSLQGSANVVNLGDGVFDPDPTGTRSAPTSSPQLPVDDSNIQCHEAHSAIPQSRSERNSSERLHMSTSSNRGSLHPHRIPLVPLQQPHDNPSVSGARTGFTPFPPSANSQSEPSISGGCPTPGGSATSQFLGTPHPVRPPRSEDNVVKSLHPPGLSMPHSGGIVGQLSYQSVPPPHLYDHTTGPEGTHEAATSFLPSASNFQMGDIHSYQAAHMTVIRGGGLGDSSIDGWKLLMEKTAPNALHNSSARFDAPKCDEDTRVEVTNELMEWIQDRSAPQRLLCMTGAAGAGKSCLQQTAAEKCAKSDILAASYFISATDPTRNTVETVIPTIAYQLGRKNKVLKSLIKATIEEDPLIFDQSLEAQTTAFVVEPFEQMKKTGANLHDLPYVILIDGLDECSSGDPKRRAEDRQAELLTAIRRCLLENDLPFRIFVTSRPEWAIHTALQPGGHLHDLAYHIQLSDKYDATADMRRYLKRRFEDIGLRINDPNWFSQDNIETLVEAGTGQFVYVATIYKYISERRTSPRARLDVVLTWTPREGQVAKPFEALDKLYYSILSAAKETYEAVDTHHGRDFLLLIRVHHVNTSGFFPELVMLTHSYTTDTLSVLLGLESRSEEALISDLRSLVALRPGAPLHLYHKSFSDFLEEPTRAKDLFVPDDRVFTHLARCLMHHIIQCPLDFDSLPDKWEELPLSKLLRDCLESAVTYLPAQRPETVEIINELAAKWDDDLKKCKEKLGHASRVAVD